jgi:hypothetical protein
MNGSENPSKEIVRYIVMSCAAQEDRYIAAVTAVKNLIREKAPQAAITEAEQIALKCSSALEECLGSSIITPVFNLNGRYEYGGTPGPVISVMGNIVEINMSAYKRPLAKGRILNPTAIFVDFPDDDSYSGNLQLPDKIEWSNHSEWIKG